MTEKISANGILGIDAGGTFTDMAFISEEDKSVLLSVKTPTCHDNMLKTISDGILAITSGILPEAIRAVNIATTLATNAIVENKMRPTGLILIGYDPEQVEKAIAGNAFGTDRVVLLKGGHDPKGNEACPLQTEGAEPMIRDLLADVESIAISGFFSVRNPSHENAVRDMVKKLSPGTYITCGHELASDLDAILRAATASLNAGLIPIIIQLLDSVERVLNDLNISAPISIVRSDGSLVSKEWAEVHPIETVLSGPAASVIGARHLAGGRVKGRPSWVVDIGGTTTDIIYLNAKGEPGISSEGAVVGGHRTLIKTIDIYTFGLGGDSRVTIGKDGDVDVGARRVKPLCYSVSERPELMEHLSDHIREPLLVREEKASKAKDRFETNVISRLRNGIFAADDILADERLSYIANARLYDMETRGIVSFMGFTPTDALHILGRLDKWSADASRQGALIMTDGACGTDVFSQDVCDCVVRKIALNVLKKSLLSAYGEVGAETEAFLRWILKNKQAGAVSLTPHLNAGLIGVGAPSWAFMENVGELLDEKAVLPEKAEVAGAVGAAVGIFSLRHSIWVTPMKDGTYRVHMPFGIKDYRLLSDAVAETRSVITPWVLDRAAAAGAVDPVISFEQKDEIFTAPGGRTIHLWTELIFNVVESEDALHRAS